ncbi:MAG TPA: MFS transporter [Candidatus Limnocylindrales bacterium]|nr:MFS transporter [Candidatus Limnocylindrales bacterium]
MTTTTAPVAQPSALAVFRRPTFRLLWSGQFISTIGDALTIAAAGILVFQRTGSAFAVGLIAAAELGPALIVGLFAGVVVDRFDRRRIMIASDLLRVVILLLIPVLVTVHIVFLYLLVAAAAAVKSFFDPALDATLPEIAPDEELGAANSLMAISSFGSTAVGFAAGGLIAALGDVELAFVIDAATFLLSALCTSLASVPKVPLSDVGSWRAVGTNLRDGLRVLIDTPILRSMLPVAIIYSLAAVGVWNALLLPFSIRTLGGTTFEYGLQEAFTSVLFVLGSLVLARWSTRLREGQWLVLGYLAMGVTGVAYGLAPNIWLAIVAVALSGFANAFTSTAGRIIRQRNTPREYRGRVMSVFSVIVSVCGIIGMLLAGLADIVDPRLLIVVSGVATLSVGLLAAVLPGIGQPAAEWRRALHLLRSAPTYSALGSLRPVTLADFETLVGLVPTLRGLDRPGREDLLIHGQIGEAPAGVCLVAQGEQGDAAYFVLDGKAIAGTPVGGKDYRSLSAMGPGDFFGEIAALNGTPRTANVVAEEPVTLLQVPAATLRRLMGAPGMSDLVVGKMNERLARTSLTDLPKIGGLDQADLRDLRTPAAPGPAAPVAAGPGEPPTALLPGV